MTTSSMIRPARRGLLNDVVSVAAVIALLVLAVSQFAGSYWVSVFTSAFALSVAILGIGLLYGQLGLVSLCQFALIGVGGWVCLRVNHAFQPPFEVSLLAGGIAASAVGVVWGLPALRLRGLHLSLVTLMLAGAFQIVIGGTGFPDGGPGFLGLSNGGERRMMARPFVATGGEAYLAYVGLVLAIAILVVRLHAVSAPGRAWALIQRDERMAIASGVRIVRNKVWAFALAGLFAGIAGGLLAGSVGQLEGRSFPASESIMLFAIAIIGGVQHWLGAIIAGIAMRAAPGLLNSLGLDGYLSQCVFGLLLVHALTSSPTGIAGQIQSVADSIRSRMRSTGEAAQ